MQARSFAPFARSFACDRMATMSRARFDGDGPCFLGGVGVSVRAADRVWRTQTFVLLFFSPSHTHQAPASLNATQRNDREAKCLHAGQKPRQRWRDTAAASPPTDKTHLPTKWDTAKGKCTVAFRLLHASLSLAVVGFFPPRSSRRVGCVGKCQIPAVVVPPPEGPRLD